MKHSVIGISTKLQSGELVEKQKKTDWGKTKKRLLVKYWCMASTWL